MDYLLELSRRTSENSYSTQYGAYCRQQQAHVQEGGSMPTRDKRLLTDLRCRKHDHPFKAEIWQRLHYVAHSNEISVKQPQRAHWTTLSARSAARRPRNPKGPALPALSYTYISPDATQASLHKKSKSCIAPPRSARTAGEGCHIVGYYVSYVQNWQARGPSVHKNEPWPGEDGETKNRPGL